MKESTAKVICAVLLILIACVNIATFEIISPLSQPTASALVSVKDNSLVIADESDEDSNSSKAEDESSTSIESSEITSSESSEGITGESSEGDTSSAEIIEEPSPSCCSYCGSQNHSYDYCAQRSIDNGAVGRWVIPSVGINVAAYHGEPSGEEAKQEICDRWDSAVYFLYHYRIPLIADHSNQEFSPLKYVSVGDEAYMDYGSYEQRYICTRVAYVYYNNGTICDENWTPIHTYDYNEGGIVCQTCNGSVQNIILVSFQPVYD